MIYNLDGVQIMMLILLMLQIKHFLADFWLQTDQMIRDKGIYGARNGIYHSLIHAIGTFIAFLILDPYIAFTMSVLDFLIHYHIDWTKSFINNRYELNSENPKFWFCFGADQMAHQLTYLFLVGWVFFVF